MYTLSAVLVAFCAIATPILLIIFIIKAIRKKPKKWIGLSALFCVAGILLFSVVGGLTMTDEQRAELESRKAEETVAPAESTQEPVSESEEKQESTQEPPEETKTQAEQFAEDNDIPVALAESLETVLAGIDLTDKSRVGIFQYGLSDITNWKQIEDWAEGQRYSAYMAQEHVFYFYVKDDTVVGVRDSHVNVFYTAE